MFYFFHENDVIAKQPFKKDARAYWQD